MKSLLCVFMVLFSVRAQNYSIIVNIKQGPVKGYTVPGYDVLAFYGIPFATAPTGSEKFKPPLPPPTWSEPFEAVNKNIICLQSGQLEVEGAEFKEDCLVVSVYVPNTGATNLPVMVIVHGGAFMRNFGNLETPIQIVNHKENVVVVTFNYRLGPVGFLCLGTPDVPGNAGLRDQVAALKWVQENIAAFGGNPADVTIAGCSAGGASVDLLMLSKTTDGLFKKVISQSGPNIGAYATQVDPIESAKNFAKLINFEGSDNLETLEAFYKNASYDQMLITVGEGIAGVVFMPCVERELGFERILDDTPYNILKKGNYIRYPILYGWAEMEGLFEIDRFEDQQADMSEDFAQFLPVDLQFDSEAQKQEVAKRVKELYFGDGPVENDDVLGYIDYNSDVLFINAMQRAVTMQVEAGNDAVYLSVFTYTDNNTNPVPYTDVRGAGHCSQMTAALDQDESENNKMKTIMRELWLNFVLTGNPTPDDNIPPTVPKWEAAGADRTPCTDLGTTIKILSGPFAEERQKLWDDIYEHHYRQPVSPYDF